MRKIPDPKSEIENWITGYYPLPEEEIAPWAYFWSETNE